MNGNAVFLKHMQVMLDLMVVAFQCDATRIITFQQGNSVCNQTYDNLGISGGHHNISHHGGNQNNMLCSNKVTPYAYQGVGYLDDGTMVVVENGREHQDETLEVTVTSVLQTAAGRMIFAAYDSAEMGRTTRQARSTRGARVAQR